MVVQACRIGPFLLSLACLLCGQQPAPGPSSMFSAEARLVLVPFNVVRGKYFALDLKPEDVALLDKGKPRDFTVFEGPGTGRSPLELVLLFDTTTLPPESILPVHITHWDRQATYEFSNHWGDAESRAVLEKNGADVRVSVYRYDHQLMQRICRSTSGPRALTRAIRRLPESLSAEEAIPLTLPPGRMTRDAILSKIGYEGPRDRFSWPISWTMEAIIAALKDSASAPSNALRALIVFSEGGAGPSDSDLSHDLLSVTTTTAEDVAVQANAAGIAVYPVVLDTDKYRREPLDGQCRKYGQQPSVNYSLVPMLRFARVGELTGGRAFYPTRIDTVVVDEILEAIRNIGLSQYVVGFAPPPAGRQQTHKLEVRLKSKDSGELQGGKRTAVY